jgi:hypothetical protein
MEALATILNGDESLSCNWKEINIQMLHTYHGSGIEHHLREPHEAPLFIKALNSLRYVRNRTAVTITGLPSTETAALVDAMKSTEPFVDLLSMCRSLT